MLRSPKRKTPEYGEDTVKNRLDFLMDLTETKNSVLSKAISFDPSYISRVRSGSRKMPQSPQFTERIASYVARNLKTDRQKQLLADELCPGKELPEDREAVEALVASWLVAEQAPLKATAADPVGGFLDHFSSYTSGSPAGTAGMPSGETCEDVPPAVCDIPEDSLSQAHFFYGNEGKRKAVESFLGRLCRSGRAFRLLLFSDEEMSWLYEDPAFARRWAGLLMRLLSTGSRIQIPHNVTRDRNEMLEAVQKWIPLYMTGAISPWYCPRLRDGILRRSLFIAEGDSAVISSSIGGSADRMLNILVTDRRAVRALEQEYANFFALCRPLMNIWQNRSARDYFSDLMQFEKQPGALLTASALPSFFTLPHSAAQSLELRFESELVSEQHARSYAAFRERMRGRQEVTEILNLPDPAAVKAGKVPVPLGDFFGMPGLAVKPEELILHLRQVIRLLRRESTYHVLFSNRIPKNIILSAREDGKARLVSAQAPTTAFGIQEPNMGSAFYEYLLHISERSAEPSKEAAVRQLEQYIERLR